MQEIDDAKTPKGALNGLIKIKKEESAYGGGGLLHFALALIILILNNKGTDLVASAGVGGMFHTDSL